VPFGAFIMIGSADRAAKDLIMSMSMKARAARLSLPRTQQFVARQYNFAVVEPHPSS
jgi:hypothetical protein